jgi:hypothetical protein
MTSDKIYPKGFRTFKRNDNAPEWVKGSLVITIPEFKDWLDELETAQYFTEYNGKSQIKFDIVETKDDKRINFVVNTYKKAK